MTHDEFIAEYLDVVEGEQIMETIPRRFNCHEDFVPKTEVATPPRDDQKRKLSSLCEGCKVDTFEIDEYYMVQFDIWQTVVPKEFQRDVLCIGCLEGYLGRQLISEDFIEAPINYMPSKSERLMNRWGQWFRDFDGPYENPEELQAAARELGERIDGLVKRTGPKYMVRVDVDTNNLVRDGLTLARLLRVVDEINVGDTVIAHDYAEEADFFAQVVTVEGKRVYLRIDWDTANPW